MKGVELELAWEKTFIFCLVTNYRVRLIPRNPVQEYVATHWIGRSMCLLNNIPFDY